MSSRLTMGRGGRRAFAISASSSGATAPIIVTPIARAHCRRLFDAAGGRAADGLAALER
jgi:hypothetical protein